MSSAMNHKKKSRYSGQFKSDVFYTISRRAFYSSSRDTSNRRALGIMANAFHRRALEQNISAKEG